MTLKEFRKERKEKNISYKTFLSNWFFTKTLMSYEDIIQFHYSCKGFKKTSIFSTIYIGICILLYLLSLIIAGILLVTNFFNGIGSFLLTLLGCLMLIFLGPIFISIGVLILGLVGICPLEFLLSKILRYDKVAAGISFVIGGLFAIPLSIFLFYVYCIW